MFRACCESTCAVAVLLLALTHPPYSVFYKAPKRGCKCTSVHGLRTNGLRTTWSPDRSWSPDHAGLGRAAACPFLTASSGLLVGRGHACHMHALHTFPRHALSCLEVFRGATHLLLQARPCPGSSATFSNPGKKNCAASDLPCSFGWSCLGSSQEQCNLP